MNASGQRRQEVLSTRLELTNSLLVRAAAADLGVSVSEFIARVVLPVAREQVTARDARGRLGMNGRPLESGGS